MKTNSTGALAMVLVMGALHLIATLRASADVVKIEIDPKSVVAPISPAFIGLGYETSAVAQAEFFSVKNSTMINLYRNLSTHGLIRIGGNVSDHTRYVPDGDAVVHAQNEVTIINQQDLTDLGKFAEATGWKIMWGLNLGTGTKEEAVKEATNVKSALGASLQSFQIGNEVEALPRFKHSYDAYHSAYLDYKAAIRAAIPDAPFSGPDSIGNIDWVTRFASAESSDMKLLTHHYYRGNAGNKETSIDKMLKADTAWMTRLGQLQQICKDHSLAFRINEVNSFSGGGKAGVSDTFASSLWCLDYMFLLASYGADGVNMQTDINHLAWISHYSPIVHDSAGVCSARPEYYGMLAFAMAARGNLIKLTLEKVDINLTAYASKDEKNQIWITLINKDFTQDAAVDIEPVDGYPISEAYRLSAPAMESTEQVTFAGTMVGADGSWSAGPAEKVAMGSLSVPHASALIVRLHQ